MSTEIEWAWAVGLFEGEGCFTIVTKTGAARLALTSTDEDVVARFHLVLGVGAVYGPYRRGQPNHKPQWVWKCGQQEDVADVIERMLPMLCSRRAARAREVQRMAQTPRRRTYRRRMVRACVYCGLTPIHTLGICVECDEKHYAGRMLRNLTSLGGPNPL